MPSTAPRSRRGQPVQLAVHVNEVRLVGRLTGTPSARQLPSGDRLLAFRLVVERAAPSRSGRGRGAGSRSRAGRTPTVDTLDCVALRRDVQRLVERATEGDLLELQGALRRRFWRRPAGLASRSEVEVTRARRAARAA